MSNSTKSHHKVEKFDKNQIYLMQKKLVFFTRHLKSVGFHIDIDSAVLAQQLLTQNDFSEKLCFQYSLRTLLCKKPQQWHSFHQHYSDFWLRKPKKSQVKSSVLATQTSLKASIEGDIKDNGVPSTQNSGANNKSTKGESRADIASAVETNEKIDFELLVHAELLRNFSESCRQLAKSLARKLRKTVRSSNGECIDLRQTIQRNLKYGGTLIELVLLSKPKILPRFTIMIDVSRSMSGYSDAFLIFALAMVKHISETRVFIFNTKLIDITTALKANRLEKIKEQLQLLNDTWGGGTRIAFSIAELRKRALPCKKANHHFIIHSDGLDTDPADSLKRQVSAIKKQYRNLIWLSPLLKNENYRVETASLKAALPYIDHLLPVHNLACLNNLANLLASNDDNSLNSYQGKGRLSKSASKNSLKGASYG